MEGKGGWWYSGDDEGIPGGRSVSWETVGFPTRGLRPVNSGNGKFVCGAADLLFSLLALLIAFAYIIAYLYYFPSDIFFWPLDLGFVVKILYSYCASK